MAFFRHLGKIHSQFQFTIHVHECAPLDTGEALYCIAKKKSKTYQTRVAVAEHGKVVWDEDLVFVTTLYRNKPSTRDASKPPTFDKKLYTFQIKSDTNKKKTSSTSSEINLITEIDVAKYASLSMTEFTTSFPLKAKHVSKNKKEKIAMLKLTIACRYVKDLDGTTKDDDDDSGVSVSVSRASNISRLAPSHQRQPSQQPSTMSPDRPISRRERVDSLDDELSDEEYEELKKRVAQAEAELKAENEAKMAALNGTTTNGNGKSNGTNGTHHGTTSPPPQKDDIKTTSESSPPSPSPTEPSRPVSLTVTRPKSLTVTIGIPDETHESKHQRRRSETRRSETKIFTSIMVDEVVKDKEQNDDDPDRDTHSIHTLSKPTSPTNRQNLTPSSRGFSTTSTSVTGDKLNFPHDEHDESIDAVNQPLSPQSLAIHTTSSGKYPRRPSHSSLNSNSSDEVGASPRHGRVRRHERQSSLSMEEQRQPESKEEMHITVEDVLDNGFADTSATGHTRSTSHPNSISSQLDPSTSPSLMGKKDGKAKHYWNNIATKFGRKHKSSVSLNDRPSSISTSPLTTIAIASGLATPGPPTPGSSSTTNFIVPPTHPTSKDDDRRGLILPSSPSNPTIDRTSTSTSTNTSKRTSPGASPVIGTPVQVKRSTTAPIISPTSSSATAAITSPPKKRSDLATFMDDDMIRKPRITPLNITTLATTATITAAATVISQTSRQPRSSPSNEQITSIASASQPSSARRENAASPRQSPRLLDSSRRRMSREITDAQGIASYDRLERTFDLIEIDGNNERPIFERTRSRQGTRTPDRIGIVGTSSLLLSGKLMALDRDHEDGIPKSRSFTALNQNVTVATTAATTASAAAANTLSPSAKTPKNRGNNPFGTSPPTPVPASTAGNSSPSSRSSSSSMSSTSSNPFARPTLNRQSSNPFATIPLERGNSANNPFVDEISTTSTSSSTSTSSNKKPPKMEKKTSNPFDDEPPVTTSHIHKQSHIELPSDTIIQAEREYRRIYKPMIDMLLSHTITQPIASYSHAKKSTSASAPDTTRFWNGIPIGAVTIVRCLLTWNAFQSHIPLSHLITSHDTLIPTQPDHTWMLSSLLACLYEACEHVREDTEALAFLLSNAIMLLHLIKAHTLTILSQHNIPSTTPSTDYLDALVILHKPATPEEIEERKQIHIDVDAFIYTPILSDIDICGNTSTSPSTSTSSSTSSYQHPYAWFTRQLRACISVIHSHLLQTILKYIESLDVLQLLAVDESSLLGSPTLDSLIDIYTYLYDLFKSSHVLPSIRNNFMACLFHTIQCKLFNCMLQTPSLLVMNTGIRLQIVYSSMEDWSYKAGGNALTNLCQQHLSRIKQLAMFLLMDKSNVQKLDVYAVCPSLNALQLDHICRLYNANKDQNADEISVWLIKAFQTDITSQNTSEWTTLYLNPYTPIRIAIDIETGPFVLSSVPTPPALQQDKHFAFLQADDPLTL